MSLELARVAAEAARNKKAARIVFLDLQGRSDLCDYQMVCSGDTDRQTKAICDAIQEACKEKAHVRPAAIEGKGSGQWILMDFGSLLVHIFINHLRDFYAIESLWPGAAIDSELTRSDHSEKKPST